MERTTMPDATRNAQTSTRELSQSRADSATLASLVDTLEREFDSLTPDEQAEEVYELTKKCRNLQNLLDYLYEKTAEKARDLRGE